MTPFEYSWGGHGKLIVNDKASLPYHLLTFCDRTVELGANLPQVAILKIMGLIVFSSSSTAKNSVSV